MFERFLEILQNIATSLAAIAVSLQSGASLPSAAAPAEPAKPAGKGKGAAATAGAAAASPAAPTAASTASSTTSAASVAKAEPAAAAVDFKRVTEVCMSLAKKTAEEGGGREALIKVLEHFLGKVEKPSLSLLQPLNKNAEIVAYVEALGKPADATSEDDALFS